MARRRSSWSRKARVAYGLSTGAQQFFQQMMRDIAQQRNAERIAERQEAADARTLARQGEMLERQTAAQRRNALFEKLPEKAATMEPDALQAYIDAGGGLFEQQYPSDFVGTGEQFRERDAHQQATQGLIESMRPPLRRKLEGTVGKSIGEATSPEQLDLSRIVGQLRGADSRVEALDPNEFLVDPTDPSQVGMTLQPEAQDYIAQAQSKAQALRSRPGERLTITRPDGSEVVTTPSQQDFASGGIQISPTSEQQGMLAGIEEKAKQEELLDPALAELKARTEARMFNLTDALTRQAKVATAGAIASAQAAAQAGSRQPTESERKAAANFAPLVNAHANALALESRGVRVDVGDARMTSVPILNRFVSADKQQYLQASRDFLSTLGLIRSGVTVRPDELENLRSTMFGTSGDDPTSMQQKQQSREIFLASMQAMVGRSADEAARIFAEAINRGQIPISVLASIEIQPEIAREMVRYLNIPVLDANGRPIGMGQ